MAIKIRRPTFYKISAVKEFTDREQPRDIFWKRYAQLKENQDLDSGIHIINFYGAGGVGKTALFKKLEEDSI